MKHPKGEIISEFVDAVGHACGWIDRDQRLSCANEVLTEMLGTSCLGRHFIACFRQPEVVNAITAGRASAAEVCAEVTPIGTNRARTFDITARPMFGGVLVVLTDRTEASDTEQMRRDFVANVSHELRTPITAFNGFLETLQGAAKDDPVARERFLGIMTEEAGRMARLVDELTHLSRLEATERLRPTDQIDLRDVVQQAVAVMEPIAKRAAAQMTTNLPNSAVMVRGDFEQLQQVATNLIENALKYSDDGGQVTIDVTVIDHTSKLRAEGANLSVTDTGAGIAAHHIARLTERFYRIDDHRSRQVGGTGLGLAIVKHIVSRHRGRLVIDSALGRGSTFSVLLPRE